MALGSTQPLTEMSTTSISWGKSFRCLGLTTLPPSCTVVMKSGKLNFLEPSGHARPVTDCFLFTYLLWKIHFIAVRSCECDRHFVAQVT